MAYVSQEDKKGLAVGIKEVLKNYGVKGSISIQNYSTLVVKLSKGGLDIIGNYNKVTDPEYVRNYIDVNTYWIESHYSDDVKDFLVDLKAVMNGVDTANENYDNSDVMTDYFDVGWYIDIRVGAYDKPYEFIG